MTLQNQNLNKYYWVKGERDKKIEWQDGLWFEENEWYYDKSRGDESLSIMKSMRKQRDDQNPNLQSIFSLGHQCCWSSKAIYLTNTLINLEFVYLKLDFAYLKIFQCFIVSWFFLIIETTKHST